MDANSGEIDSGWLEKQLDSIEVFSTIRSIELECPEEVNDDDYFRWPRDVRYRYDFSMGNKDVWSSCNWRSYRGFGDDLRPDFRNLDGSVPPFDFSELGGRCCAMACSSDDSEVVVPECILRDGKEQVVRGIGPKCFAKMKTLESVVLPRTIEYIASDAFEGSRRNLRSVRFEDDAEGATTFLRVGTTLALVVSPEKELAIPEDVTELGSLAFGGCWNLRTIILHDGMKKPTMKALQSCGSLTYVVLTDGSTINVSKKDAMRCFTISRGVIRYDYEKCERYGIKQPGRKASGEPPQKTGATPRRSTKNAAPTRGR